MITLHSVYVWVYQIFCHPTCRCSLTLPKNKRTVINYSLLIIYERNKTACGFELYIQL